MDIIEVMKALGDETRLRMLYLLSRETLCVCDLEAILKINQSNASRHLTKLKMSRLIVSEKQAQWVYYRINPAALEGFTFIGDLLLDLAAWPQAKSDLERLKAYRKCGGDCEHSVVLE
jgi:ArsR family transcriptional regulator